MMSISATFPLTTSSERHYQAVRLPYVGGASMYVVLPDAGHFAEVERASPRPRPAC